MANPPLSDELCQQTLKALREHGTQSEAARALGIPRQTYLTRLATARRLFPEASLVVPRIAGAPLPVAPPSPPAAPLGQLRAMPREVRDVPAPGMTRVYILSCAQNNTGLHERCWASLQTLAAHDKAEVLISAFTYATQSRAASGAKRKTAQEGSADAEWWDARVEPFFADRRIELAPGLVWCGELQILPTAANPISGMESYTGRASTIIPHVKFAVQSVPSPKHSGTKLIYTTGCVTLRNYIQKKAGQKAEFHHGYGALIVEVTSDGSWFVRQLNADSDGVIYDLDRKIDGDKVTYGHRPEALVWGDVHVSRLEPDIRALQWGGRGILDTLCPKRQVLHDLLDFRCQNHHERKDPWKSFAKHIAGQTSVAGEVAQAAEFLEEACRPWCETVVVRSNHDEALVRWLKEADFREDPGNSIFLLEATLASYVAYRDGDTSFDAIEWAFGHFGQRFVGVKFLRRDEEYIVCPDANDGIDLGMHGDKGANGGRGALQGFARTGRKCIVADSHTAGHRDGAMQVGVSGNLDMGWNEGQSSWSRTHGLVYPNGKRTLFTVWQGKFRA